MGSNGNANRCIDNALLRYVLLIKVVVCMHWMNL